MTYLLTHYTSFMPLSLQKKDRRALAHTQLIFSAKARHLPTRADISEIENCLFPRLLHMG